jgi:hypothetical protein
VSGGGGRADAGGAKPRGAKNLARRRWRWKKEYFLNKQYAF